jgi:hypothetical protein
MVIHAARRLVCLAAVAIAGCATTERVWMRAGASQQDFYMDKGQCQAQAFGVPGMNTFQVAMVFNSCMQGKGWYLEERPIRQEPPARSKTASEYNACMDQAKRVSGNADPSSEDFKNAFWRCMENR